MPCFHLVFFSEYPPEWSDVSQSGGRNTLGRVSGKENQVFVLPQSADMYKGYNVERLENPRLYKPPLYSTEGGRQVQTSVNYSRNVSDNFPDQSMQNYSSQSFDRHSVKAPRDMDYNYDGDGFMDRSGTRKSPARYRSRSQPIARHSLGPGYPAPERPRSRGHSYHSDSQSHPDVSFLDSTVRYRPNSYHTRPRSRSPHQPTSQTPTVPPTSHNRSYPSYHGNSTVPDEEDEEVFMPPPISSILPGKPGFPRHSSMKPSAQQTYLTDDHDHSSTHPFLTNDISSVLPSPFSDSHTKLPYRPYQRQYPSTSDQRVPYGSPTILHNNSHEPSYNDMDDTVVPRQPSLNQSMSRTLSGDRSSSDSSGRPMNYTRDQLLGVVDKVRKGPRAARKGNVPGPRTSGSAFDSFERPSVGGRHGAQIPESVKPPSVIVRDRPSRGHPQDMADSRTSMNTSSGLGSALGRPSRDPRSYPREDLTPDSLSSGIGSRNTSSQLTGSSLHSRPSRLGSNLTSHDLSTDSAQPYLDYPLPHRKDISGDENYEFDSYNAVESDLLEALRNYSEVNNGNDELLNVLQDGLNTTGLLHELYPKPSRQSRYSDSEKRFEKLRGEYQKYRQEQQEHGSGMESNNRSSTYSSNGSGYGSSFVPYSQQGNSSNVSQNYGYPGKTNQYFGDRGDNSNYKAGPMDSDML